MTTMVDLDEEYRLTRTALLNAGVEMTDSIDALLPRLEAVAGALGGEGASCRQRALAPGF
jgi:hypothetical protein